jgi:hypothetical protein
MKYELRINSPSLTVLATLPRAKCDKRQPERTSILLKNGDGSVTETQFKTIQDNPIVMALVREGNLRFRDSEAMEEVFGVERANYEERIAALQDQEDRRDNPTTDEDVAELTRLIGEMQLQQQEQAERHAKEMSELRASIKPSQA